MNGIGSDAFALVWDGQAAARTQRLGSFARGLDAASGSPATAVHADRRAGTASRCRARCPRGSPCRGASASFRSPTCSRPPSSTRVAASSSLPPSRGSGPIRSSALPASRASPRPSCRGGRAPRAGELFRFPEQARDPGADRTQRRRIVLSRRTRRDRSQPRAATQGGAMTPEDLAAHAGRLGRAGQPGLPRACGCTRSRPTARASPR